MLRHSFRPLSRQFATSTTPPIKPIKKATNVFKKYGSSALLVYSVLTAGVFAGTFATITFYNITPQEIGRLMYSIKEKIPFLEPPSHVEKKEGYIEPDGPESHNWFAVQLGKLDPNIKWIVTQSLLAMGITKLFSPVKVCTHLFNSVARSDWFNNTFCSKETG
jgi:hypothetical protein